MSYTVVPHRSHRVYYLTPHPTIPGSFETHDNEIVDVWTIEDAPGHEATDHMGFPFRHWHKESLLQNHRFKEGSAVMQYDVMIKTKGGGESLISGPHSQAMATVECERLQKQHPESTFEVVEHTD